MKIADLRVQSTNPTAPSAGVVGLFANASGFLTTITSAGVVAMVANQLTGNFTAIAQTGGVAQFATGSVVTYVYGGKNSITTTGLATPDRWIPFVTNGITYLVPGYTSA